MCMYVYVLENKVLRKVCELPLYIEMHSDILKIQVKVTLTIKFKIKMEVRTLY